MNSQETINRQLLHNWYSRAEWTAADCVPDGLSRINGLVTHQQPFAVLVTATANGDREQSFGTTVQTICAAHEAGWICSPIKLSYRQDQEQLLQSDLALAIYKRDNDTDGDAPTKCRHSCCADILVGCMEKIMLCWSCLSKELASGRGQLGSIVAPSRQSCMGVESCGELTIESLTLVVLNVFS